MLYLQFVKTCFENQYEIQQVLSSFAFVTYLITRRKYVKKSKSELSQRLEEESSGDSYTTKRHKPSPKSRHVSHPVKKVKEEKKNPEVTIPGGYCSDCYMSIRFIVIIVILPIELPKEPWKEMKPCKPAQIRNRGKHLGQAQYQMESYLNCVSSMYNNRSAIPDGLHDTQLVLNSVDLLSLVFVQ